MAVIVAVIAALASLTSSLAIELSRRRAAARLQVSTAAQQAKLERLQSSLATQRDAATQHTRAAEVMATYSKPVAQAVFDLQSRLFNISGGFRGDGDLDYYRTSTLFVIADLLGWFEIVRREVQFLDLGSAEATRRVRWALEAVRDSWAENSSRLGMGDGFYLYRGEQRAIGELMVDTPAAGPTRTRGYASFVSALEGDQHFARWFDRLDAELTVLDMVPPRLVRVQRVLVDLLDLLDPERTRFPMNRDRLPGAG
ncbi:hypothetical protein [Actinomycetospora sp. TBRC 11914]|uniref:hypothetical protein n=1 Tax=Actinomycetospora sp. TBRC 11914 TaxID=2729387 RepID=UPI00145C9F39|nr:hypothetical protein [Actinomycetospora sp. TBRC 11914]NMO93917.1 hypothetical protein [Actinomycetospora sp. TBRC 11914]